MTSTPRQFLRTISILHLGMALAPLLMGVVFYSTTEISTNNTLDDDIFVYIFPVLALAGILASNFMFKVLTKDIEKKESLREKLAVYQSASIIRYALLEGPAILNIVWFSTNGNLLFLTIGGAMVLFLLIQRPTKPKVEQALVLKGEHKRQFDRLDEPMPS